MTQTYRVETFIIPIGNHLPGNYSWTKTDDAKITDKLKKLENEDKINDYEVISNTGNLDSCEPFCDTGPIVTSQVSNTLSDISLNEQLSNDISNKKNNVINKANRDNDMSFIEMELPNSKHIFIHDDVLESICEMPENAEEKRDQLCYHGCKNGCSAVVPTPQEVSEETFQEHWLQKLETIKKKETILRKKEQDLETKERLLHLKEQEIKMLHKLLKERLEQLELHIAQSARVQKSDQQVDTSGLEPEEEKKKVNRLFIEPNPVLRFTSNEIINIKHKMGSAQHSVKTEQLDSGEEEYKKLSILTSKSDDCLDTRSCSPISSDNTITTIRENPTIEAQKNIMTSKGCYSSISSTKLGTHISRKVRKTKPSYEDLDTTLSADIGDSSFVQTSQKFDPKAYRRPYAFRRTASERRVLRCDKENMPSLEMDQHKILQRVTKNISASKDKDTKFQNYGLIDHNVHINSIQDLSKPRPDMQAEKKYSYLNLETALKTSLQKVCQESKDRPISWNGGVNDWSQKKQDSTTYTQKVPMKDFDNKDQGNAAKKSTAPSKKKERCKIFTIFR